MKELALILALALATTPAFARAGGVGGHRGGVHTGRSVGFHGYRHVYRGGGYGYVTTDIMATTDIMVITVVIPEPPLA
jgi:hypothetical protein